MTYFGSKNSDIGCLGIVVGNLLGILILWAGVSILGAILPPFFQFLAATWNVCLLLAVSYFGWRMARRQRNITASAARAVLLPTTIGLALVLLLEVAFGLTAAFSSSNLAEQRMRLIQNGLIEFYLGWKNFEDHVTLPFSLALICVIVAISRALDRPGVVERFLAGKKIVAASLIVLMTVASFTFFARLPLQYLVNREHEEKLRLFRIDLNLDMHEVAKDMAIVMLTDDATRMSPDERIDVRLLLEGIAPKLKEERAKVSLSEVAEAMARKDWEGTHKSVSARRNGTLDPPLNKEELIIGHPPGSISERHRQSELLEAEDAKVDSLREVKARKFAALREMFVTIVASAIPEMKGLIGAYVDELVGNATEYVSDKYILDWYRSGHRIGDQHADEFDNLVKKPLLSEPATIHFAQSADPKSNSAMPAKANEQQIREAIDKAKGYRRRFDRWPDPRDPRGADLDDLHYREPLEPRPIELP